MSKKNIKENKMGEIVFKLSVDTDGLDVDLDRIIKKLKRINRFFYIIDLKKKTKDLLSYLKLRKK